MLKCYCNFKDKKYLHLITYLINTLPSQRLQAIEKTTNETNIIIIPIFLFLFALAWFFLLLPRLRSQNKSPIKKVKGVASVANTNTNIEWSIKPPSCIRLGKAK